MQTGLLKSTKKENEDVWRQLRRTGVLSFAEMVNIVEVSTELATDMNMLHERVGHLRSKLADILIKRDQKKAQIASYVRSWAVKSLKKGKFKYDRREDSKEGGGGMDTEVNMLVGWSDSSKETK